MKCPQCYFENPADTQFCGKCATPLPPPREKSATRTKTLDLSPLELPIGSVFAGRYQVIEELGRGGMGKVYKAYDMDIQDNIAIKLLRLEIASDKKTIERFRNELKFARKITHKNVCRMYDLNKEGKTSFITMEYIPGEDLKSTILRTGPLTVGKAIFITKQVCEGLAEAHSLGIVHRDLKPHNIMIDKEGNAKIMDFGIARSLEAEEITHKGTIIGTPHYMSPEQIEGKEVDLRSDLYSLGVVLYEMVTGRLPFEGDTTLSIAVKHKSEIPLDPRKLNTQITNDLSRVVLKCLEKDKEKRYQKAEDLLSELTRIEKEMPSTERFIARKKFGPFALKQDFRSSWLPRLLVLVLIAGAGYLILTTLLQRNRPREEGMKTPLWKNSIAILPFKDLSTKRDQEFFCEGMTEAIITKLSSVLGLKVVPYHSVEKYKSTNKEIKEIGSELSVENILTPTLRKEDSRIRITAQLISVREGFNIRSFEYEEELDSVFKVQDDISIGIVHDLEIQFQEDKLKALKAREPSDVRAYESFLMGRHYEKQYRNTRKTGDFETSVRMYKRAIEIDPNYALAYWGLGNAYESCYTRENDRKYLDLMLKNYQSAYKIAPDLAEANLGLGWTSFYKENLDAAYKSFKRAFELDPNNSQINFDIGSFLRSIGLYGKAIQYFSKAIDLDPFSVSSHILRALCYMYLGDFEVASARIKEALLDEKLINMWTPLDEFRLRLSLATQFIMMKNFEEAEVELSLAEKLNPGNSMISCMRAWIYAAKGEKQKALEGIKGINPYSKPYLVTSIYSLLGMKDEAIQNIQDGIDNGFQYVQDYLYSYPFLTKNPYYSSLLSDPRFQKILKREKEKYEEKLMKYGKL